MSSPLSESLEQILCRFDEAWEESTPPSIEEYLFSAGFPERLPLLVELIKRDMERRFQRGERLQLEEMYLPRFRELDDAPSHLLDLVVHEYELQRQEPGVSCERYVERWPRFRDELARRFQTIRFLDPTKDSAATLPALAPDSALPPGTSLGHYELLKELGHGGMGVVYQALDRKRGRQVALKTIRGMNADALYRFKKEFRLCANLYHPHLVSLYELIAEEGHWFFTMELVEGTDFLRYVRGRPDALRSHAAAPLDAPEQFQRLRQSLRQLVEGIEALHGAGRMHRDLKPSNVMVTPTGRVVLLDFGLIAQQNPQHLHESTTGHLVGTAAYMSPEQVRSEPLTPASDWYSVGVILYEALTGRLPFVGSVFQMLLDKQRLDPPSPRSLAPNLPEELEALCSAWMSHSPAARPLGRDGLRLLGDSSADSVVSLEMAAPDTALVGRGEQFDALLDAYAASRKRRTVALFLTGSSGVGKSSLLQLFLQQLRAKGEAVVLTGQCYEQESLPYKAFDGVIDALSRYLRHSSPLEVQAVLPRDAASLLRVFPMLRRVEALLSVPQGQAPPDLQQVRQRAFASLRELLARLADRKPVVISIDDLQWGDADSASLLTELIRPPDAPCFLFVGCYRREESGSSFLTALAEADRLLWSEVDRRELSLDPLSLSEAEELAARLLTSTEAENGCASTIARESGGNPFFVYELVRYLRGQFGRSLTEGAIDLGDVLWRRIEQLPVETRELLAVVALAARPLPQDVACRAAGLAEGRIEESRILRLQRLVRGTGMSGSDLLVTYHDRIREIFHTHLSAENTRRLHRSLAEALEAWGDADLEWLAMHWEYAGGRSRAGHYYGRAADRAAETLAFDNAADLYQRALQMRAHDSGECRQLQRKLGDALANAGRCGEAAQAYQVLVADASGSETIELQCKVAQQYLISGHLREGLAAAQILLHSVDLSIPETPSRAILGIVFMEAWLWLRGVKFRERPEAEIPARELNRIDASWVMATSLGLIDPVRGAYFQIRSLLLSLQVGEPYRITRALAGIAAYNACAGSSASKRTHRLLNLSAELAQRIGDPRAQAMVLVVSGMVAHLEGRWREAFTYSSQAEDFLRGHCTGVHWELSTARAFQVWSLLYLGEFVEMSRLCARSMKEAQALGDLQGVANLLFFAVPVLSMVADQSENGYRELTEELDRWTRKEFQLPQFHAMALQVQLLLYLDRATTAEQVFRRMSEIFDRSALKRVQLMRMLRDQLNGKVQLVLAREARNPIPYLRAAERSAVRLDREKQRIARSRAILIRAAIANRKGNLDTAKRLLELASSEFAACEMGLDAASARWCLGRTIGGDRGKELVAEAERWMTAQGIRNPLRISHVYTPGFDEP